MPSNSGRWAAAKLVIELTSFFGTFFMSQASVSIYSEGFGSEGSPGSTMQVKLLEGMEGYEISTVELAMLYFGENDSILEAPKSLVRVRKKVPNVFSKGSGT